MLPEGRNDKVPAALGERDDPNAPVLSALDAADQAFRDETVHSNADRAWREIDDRTYRVNGQRPLVQQDFQHAEIRFSEAGVFNAGCRVARQRAHRLHHYEPDVFRLLSALGHKNLNPLKAYLIKYIDINIIDTMSKGVKQKENLL